MSRRHEKEKRKLESKIRDSACRPFWRFHMFKAAWEQIFVSDWEKRNARPKHDELVYRMRAHKDEIKALRDRIS